MTSVDELKNDPGASEKTIPWFVAWQASERATRAHGREPAWVRARRDDLRHEEACRLLADGVDIRAIQLILGHSDVKQTQRFLNVTDQELRKTLSWRHESAMPAGAHGASSNSGRNSFSTNGSGSPCRAISTDILHFPARVLVSQPATAAHGQP
jgi:hypothetical protein